MTRNTRLGIAAAVVAAAVIAFVALKPGDTTTTTTTTTGARTATTAQAPAPKPAPEIPTIAIRGGRPVGGVQSITVRKGEQIRFTVTDDRAQNVHLHGYDVEKPVAPGAPARYALPATITGVFEIEIEDTATPIGKLTVNP